MIRRSSLVARRSSTTHELPATSDQRRFSLYGIVGYPLAHTLSPMMQQAAFDARHVRACYMAFAVPPRRLGRAVRLLRRLAIAGFNVTVPHKERIAEYLDGVDPTARAIGAVNTVVRRGRRLVGYNTDALGLLAAWREIPRLRMQGATVLLLGAGGAARAVLWVLAHGGARRVIITNRTPSHALRLQHWARHALPRLALDVIPWSRRHAALARQHPTLIVNTTSLGLHATDPSPLSVRSLPRATIVYDLTYRRPTTTLVAAARRRGRLAYDGRSMLVYQGARAFTLWTRRPPPLTTMRRALERALRRTTRTR